MEPTKIAEILGDASPIRLKILEIANKHVNPDGTFDYEAINDEENELYHAEQEVSQYHLAVRNLSMILVEMSKGHEKP